MHSNREHAVVVGASVAGLLAARVLSDHFARVTIIERDELPATLRERKGVPQANHLHVLLPRGAQIIENFFPGIGAELDAAGAATVNVGKDFGWLGPFGWLPAFRPTLPLRGCSRGLFESILRERARACPRIVFLDGHEARDIILQAGRVTGLRVRRVSGTAAASVLSVDLLVEATGRGSQLPAQLGALDYHAPEESVVDAFVGYGSCVFEGTAVLPNAWKMLYVLWTPELPRAAALLPIEGKRFIVTCVGAQRDYPPADLSGFIAYAGTLRTSAIYDAIRNARPLSPVAVSRSTRNRLRHYERLPAMPRGLVVVGDAVCAFNPIYGQGMTVAALHAELLADWLRRPIAADNSELEFHARVASSVAPAWGMATGEDFRFDGTIGQPPLGLRLMHNYLDRVFRVAVSDPEMAKRLVRVFLMVDAPTDLVRPNIALRTLRQALRRSRVSLSVPPWPKASRPPPA